MCRPRAQEKNPSALIVLQSQDSSSKPHPRIALDPHDYDKMLMFRDWLRSNDADRELYERIKRELAKQTWKYVQNYADAKTAVVEEIVACARAARDCD